MSSLAGAGRLRLAPGGDTGPFMHRVTVEHVACATVVSAAGEVDAYVAPELEEALAGARAAALVVVDLGRVAFLDSTALGVIVRETRAASKQGRSMRVVLPTGTARRIFEITTLDRVLPTATSREDALAES